MIINLRGTSGSGKSTIIRKVMELYDYRFPFRKTGEKRRQPLGYYLSMASVDHRRLMIPGHYATACGGCDTISGYDRTFEMIKQAHGLGMHVLFEGLLLSGDVKRIMGIRQYTSDLRVIALDTSLEVCLASVNERRRVKKPDADDVNPKTTTSKYKGVQSAMRKFQAAGMDVHWADRDYAFGLIREWLQLW